MTQPMPTLIAPACSSFRKPSRVCPDDLWQLGEHRLLCGDCTDRDAVTRLMLPSEEADLLLTDPPYGVQHGSSRKPGQYLSPMEGDALGSVKVLLPDGVARSRTEIGKLKIYRPLGEHGTYDLLRLSLIHI